MKYVADYAPKWGFDANTGETIGAEDTVRVVIVDSTGSRLTAARLDSGAVIIDTPEHFRIVRHLDGGLIELYAYRETDPTQVG